MAIGVLVEALLPGGGVLPWHQVVSLHLKMRPAWQNGLGTNVKLLGKLGIKVAEALSGIIGGIVSWILNRAKDVVGWVSQNLRALIVGIGGLIYTYMLMRK